MVLIPLEQKHGGKIETLDQLSLFSFLRLSIPSGYNRNGAIGIGTAGGNNLGSGHGTSAAGLAAGKNFGLAFKANIWNMPAISDNVGMDIETAYDLISFFHQYKPVNTETGKETQLLSMVPGVIKLV